MLGKFTFLLLLERTLWYSFMQSQSARLPHCYPADADVHRGNGAEGRELPQSPSGPLLQTVGR